MAKDYIGYEALAERALRSVVRDALRRAEAQGLIGSHHFYITFKTHDAGVDIPEFLKERYPDEMTIVIQRQYWGLKVEDDFFEVTLTFQKLPANLHIPFEALTAFADPGVQFGLQFRNATALQKAPGMDLKAVPATPPEASAEAAPESKSPVPEPKSVVAMDPQVVSLDKFRKK